jgi:hypothetical protein
VFPVFFDKGHISRVVNYKLNIVDKAEIINASIITIFVF